MSIRSYLYYLFAGLLLLLLCLQSWMAWSLTRTSGSVLQDLAAVDGEALKDEKVRQEVAALRIENERNRYFWSMLIANSSTAVSVLAVLSGAWIALDQYLSVRRRDRLDRAAEDLAELWKAISSETTAVRAGGIAGLQEFFTDERKEFHTRVASALALVGRMDNTSVVLRTLAPVIEYGMREYTEAMKSVSWHGLKILRLNFQGLDLRGLDLRDSMLEEVNLNNADLTGARLNAARLIGARMEETNLQEANLEFADLASASLKGADLRRANLRNIRILHADFQGAKLEGAEFASHAIDWRLARHWRTASFDPSVKRNLFKTYGPPTQGPRVLMLMWEYPRLVTGGGWTAAFHQLKNLRSRGCNLTVMVPLPESLIDRFVFGNEIEVIAVGQEEESEKIQGTSTYSDMTYSAYGSPSRQRTKKPAYQYTGATPSLMERIDQFRLDALRSADALRIKCDVIHAHDWLMFSTAQALSRELGVPWIAHFHSLEADRQIHNPNANVQRLEAAACHNARGIVAVSQVTKNRLVSEYKAPAADIVVVPNCLSESGVAEANLGDQRTKSVVFLGRLTAQKGPDLFASMARQLVELDPSISFHIYGQGAEESRISKMGITQVRNVPDPIELSPQNVTVAGLPLQFMEFSKIAPIQVNSDTKAIETVGVEVSDSKMKKVLEMEILKRGFTAYPTDHHGYSHRIETNVTGGESHKDYLISTRDIKGTTTSANRFLSISGHLEWERRNVAFDGASAVVVSSRYEPFGMVVLEAMRHGVPVFYPQTSGVAEVLNSGIKIDPHDMEGTARQILAIIQNEDTWHETVNKQFDEIATYSERGYETRMQSIWELASDAPV